MGGKGEKEKRKKTQWNPSIIRTPKDTSINRTPFSVSNDTFVYSITPEMRTRHYSRGHFLIVSGLEA